MSQEDKATLKSNIFKLLIGIILLIACFFYLKNHPAEQIALYSGVKNIVQKIEIFGFNITGKNGELLSKKFDLESKYLEMIHFAEEKGCINNDFVQDLHTTYETLLKEDKNQIQNYITRYTIAAADYEMSIYNDCGGD